MAEHFTLKNNLIFVLAEAAGGVYNSDQMRTLCEVADSESAFLKITEDQRIGFMLDPNKLPEIQSQVRKCGIILKSYKGAGVPSPRACLGELCTHSQQPSLGDALELTTHLLKSFPTPRRHSTIGINGCGRACLGSSTEDIHVVAEASGYKVSIGGKGSEIPQQAQLLVENVSRNELPGVLERILAVFYEKSSEDERFFDVIERVGLTPFFDCLPEHLMPVFHDTSDSEEASVSEDVIADSQSADADQISPEQVAEAPALDEFGDELTEASGTGLVQSDENLTIDELIDQSSDESPDAMSVGVSPDESIEIDEPLVDISDTPLIAGVGDDQDLDENDLPSQEADLLEDAEFEDGTLDDVSRIRDAIRTEMSMSGSSGQESFAEKHLDLLDEISSDSEEAFADVAESQDERSPVSDELVIADDTFDDSVSSLDSMNRFEAADEIYPDDTLEEPSSAMHVTEKAGKRRDSKVSSGFENNAVKNTPTGLSPVKGRLSIRFLGPQLAIELPSGMCFELPLDAVQEGSQFSMELPDGELIMERDGSLLLVKLGLLQMKFPIPAQPTQQVA